MLIFVLFFITVILGRIFIISLDFIEHLNWLVIANFFDWIIQVEPMRMYFTEVGISRRTHGLSVEARSDLWVER